LTSKDVNAATASGVEYAACIREKTEGRILHEYPQASLP
jgi:hypothetical protein